MAIPGLLLALRVFLCVFSFSCKWEWGVFTAKAAGLPEPAPLWPRLYLPRDGL